MLLGERECPLGMGARTRQVAAMKRDDGDRKVILRHLEAVLDGDLVRRRRVGGGELPSSAPELDPCEPPESARGPGLVARLPLFLLTDEERACPVTGLGRGERVGNG